MEPIIGPLGKNFPEGTVTDTGKIRSTQGKQDLPVSLDGMKLKFIEGNRQDLENMSRWTYRFSKRAAIVAGAAGFLAAVTLAGTPAGWILGGAALGIAAVGIGVLVYRHYSLVKAGVEPKSGEAVKDFLIGGVVGLTGGGPFLWWFINSKLSGGDTPPGQREFWNGFTAESGWGLQPYPLTITTGGKSAIAYQVAEDHPDSFNIYYYHQSMREGPTVGLDKPIFLFKGDAFKYNKETCELIITPAEIQNKS